jgi:hypothetical protein
MHSNPITETYRRLLLQSHIEATIQQTTQSTTFMKNFNVQLSSLAAKVCEPLNPETKRPRTSYISEFNGSKTLPAQLDS